jgi:hypothetical protein
MTTVPTWWTVTPVPRNRRVWSEKIESITTGCGFHSCRVSSVRTSSTPMVMTSVGTAPSARTGAIRNRSMPTPRAAPTTSAPTEATATGKPRSPIST